MQGEIIEKRPDNDIESERSRDIMALEVTKKTERTGNVYENKGGLWKKLERTGNVIENKGSYAMNPGMLLITNGVTRRLE